MFVITLKKLHVMTTLGVYDWEKEAKRPVVLTIALQIADSKAGDSDAMDDAVDYAMVEERVIQRLEGMSYQLIEKLVTDIGQLILSLDSRIGSVHLEADKPGALRQAESVSVSAEFTR